jgi:plasmid stabilization system protein ParE
LNLGIRAGAVVPEFNLDHFREVLAWPYRVIYEIRDEYCYVVAVIHGSRDLPRHVKPPSGPG